MLRVQLLQTLRQARRGRTWIRQVVIPWFWSFDWLQLPGGIPKARNGRGVSLSVSLVAPVKVISGGPGEGPYTVDVYADGRYDDQGDEQTATARNETLYLVGVAADYALAADSWLEARAIADHWEAAPPAPAGANAQVAMLLVTSGTGTSYLASVYANGLPPTTPSATGVALTLPMVNAGETVPAGTPVLATRLGAGWVGQLAVWLEDEA